MRRVNYDFTETEKKRLIEAKKAEEETAEAASQAAERI